MTIEELVVKDPTFSESSFIAKVDNTFIMILTAIMTENLERVKHKVGNEVFNKLTEKLEKLRIENSIQMYDELNVKDSYISNIEEQKDYYEITVTLISRYMDYTIDRTTKEYKAGNNRSRVERTNTLVFRKNKAAKKEKSVRKCPSCGAPMDVNNTGKCSYCGTIYNTEEYDWLLVSIVAKN